MGSNVAIEIERKYIIRMPDFDLLRNQTDYTESKITQIYLPSEPQETHRIRRREYADRVVCTETKKIRIDIMSSTEIESDISESDFNSLSVNLLSGTKPIEKVRHTFIFGGQLFEIDVYPLWKNTAIMETELESREALAEIPPFIEIIREVTGNKAYSNASMSRDFPKEDIIYDISCRRES